MPTLAHTVFTSIARGRCTYTLADAIGRLALGGVSYRRPRAIDKTRNAGRIVDCDRLIRTKTGYTVVTRPVKTQKGYRQVSRNPLILLVEERRIELPTFALRTRRSPS